MSLDLVAVEEAARVAGVSPAAVHKSHQRGTMPAPVPVAGTDVLVWRRSDIEAWARERRRPGRPSLGRDHPTNAGF